MSGDLVSLRLLLVAAEPPQQDLWREGALQASVPIDFEARDAAAAKAALGKGDIDICVLDGELDDVGKASVIKAARAKKPAPLVFLSAPKGSARPDNIDGALTKPGTADDARKAIDTCIRAKLPTPVLIVDDSDTVRGIVRKILAASRFDLDSPRGRRQHRRARPAAHRGYRPGVSRLQHAGPQRRRYLVGDQARTSPEVAIVMMSLGA